MEDHVFLFVFSRRNIVQVLTHEQARWSEGTLKSNGWKHTATIDARAWIEHIANDEAYCGPNIDELRGISHGG